ncbi:aldehyde ferredoxin oxidoreductase family protein [Sinanaerobacter chloroacetimidivorans]|uniref:Aldehyde ferredoxin oxidoreductase family protein n=1 Tax=Sinanaerobacter chloroacetimidivorans TaxID=2818044 RepID=A0A8J8B1M6_9FIRM|nr:aldehyde ferredoxin oxidoreductase family protein [Sinanaerobacter chloroacetimidivorans]MBR0597892.1 aldehyde ferredoxin oxidoreductase family protein [Sinanaerobacter chloroacetimidivorans]
MYGFIGKLLRVNLSAGTIKEEAISQSLAEKYIGGRGLGTKIYIDEVAKDVDAFSEDNKLILLTGPLTGTFGTSAGRLMWITKAPLTGTIGCANSGGQFGPELKFAGYDGIIFEGKSEKPVYLYVNDGKAELRSAEELWGKTVYETTDQLVEATDPDAKVSCIGPAGENGVLYATIMNDKHRAAGRGGLGAVMGSKNLKAVVARGTGGIKVADKAGFLAACHDARTKLKENPVTGAGLGAYGTEILVNIINASGGLPKNNWRDGALYEDADDISGETLAEKYLVRNKGCFACSIACGRVTKIKDGPYKSAGEGPEYEAAWALGASCGINNLEAVCKVNFLCNEYGMDPITLGSTFACAMELFDAGLLPKEDIGGNLAFGNTDSIVEFALKTANREGFGDKLAEGSYRLADSYGAPELSMSVKKQEMPAYDGRSLQGMGLEYATSNRGGCHVRGYLTSPEILGIPVKLDPLVTEGKANILKIFQDLTAVVDSSGICLFTTFGIGLPEICNMLRTCTGWNLTDEEILAAGDRIWNMEKLYNLDQGFTKKDDTLPPRLLYDPLPEGPAKGKVCELDVMLKEYYELRGWDTEGIPTGEKLAELGL